MYVLTEQVNLADFRTETPYELPNVSWWWRQLNAIVGIDDSFCCGLTDEHYMGGLSLLPFVLGDQIPQRGFNVPTEVIRCVRLHLKYYVWLHLKY